MKNASNNKCTLLDELADRRERVEHNKKVGTIQLFLRKGNYRHGSTHLYPDTQEAEARGSLVASHPGLPWPMCLAIFILTTSIQLFPGSLLETMAASMAVIDLRGFSSGMKRGGAQVETGSV